MTGHAEVERLSLAKLEPAAFRRRFVAGRRPCVITDFAAAWPAMEKWSFGYLKEIAGGQRIGVVDSAEQAWGKGAMTVSDLVDGIERGESLRTMMLSLRGETDLLALAPQLNGDFENGSHLMGGFGGALWPLLPPNPPQFYINATGTVTPLHYDTVACPLFHTVLRGSKRWLLYPYEAGAEVGLRRILGFGPYFPTPRADFQRPLGGGRSQEVVLRQGETLFLPSCMLHRVETLEPTISLTIRSHGSSLRNLLHAAAMPLLIPPLGLHRLLVLSRRVRRVLADRSLASLRYGTWRPRPETHPGEGGL